MTAGMANPEEVMVAIQQVVEGGMQRGGLSGGVEAFCRFVDGDEAFENLDPQLRERMLGNGETCLVTESSLSGLRSGRSHARRRRGARAGNGRP